METFRDVYIRFIENYRTSTGGINLYPQFDYDLDLLLEWLEGDEIMAEVATDGSWYSDVDCSWRPAEGEVNE